MTTTNHYQKGDERFYPSPYGDVPSVTTITAQLMKHGLIPWAAGQAVERIRPVLEMLKNGMISVSDLDIEDVLAKAKKEHKEVKEAGADTGNKMHEFIANYYRMLRNGGGLDMVRQSLRAVIDGTGQPKIFKAWDAFLKWDDYYCPQAILVEYPVFSSKLFAGRLDFYGTLKPHDRYFVIDWKSANSIYEETALQIAAYSTALMETNADVQGIAGWGCLRLDKESGEPEWREYSGPEIASAAARFLRLVEYWHLTNNWKQSVSKEKKEAKKKAKEGKCQPKD